LQAGRNLDRREVTTSADNEVMSAKGHQTGIVSWRGTSEKCQPRTWLKPQLTTRDAVVSAVLTFNASGQIASLTCGPSKDSSERGLMSYMPDLVPCTAWAASRPLGA